MIETISFGDSFPSLQSYEDKNWFLNETRNVEFFPNCFYKVTLLSTESPDLQNYLKEIDVQTPIALDLEWENEINSFQFAIQNRALVIRHPNGPGNQILYDYLLNHTFFAKGCHNDKIKLKQKFGYNFESNIEDIERTRLQPYGYSLNFIQMTLQFAGKPTTEFKDVRITKSNWDQHFLTIRQVLYAAFDVVSIFQSYKNFPPPKQMVHHKAQKKEQKHENNKDKKPKIITNKKDFNLYQNEWKTDGQKILLKQSFSKKIQCYTVLNYDGKTDYISIQSILKSIPQQEIDHISFFAINDKNFLFISLFLTENTKSEDNKLHLSKIFPNNHIISIPILDPSDSTDNDVIFLYDLPNELINEDKLTLFLSCFGSDFRFAFDENHNARIQPHRAQSSLRMKHFIPYIVSDDGQQMMKISIFPFYLPMVRATFPSNFSTTEEVKQFFSQCGKVENVKIFKKKSNADTLTAIVTFSTVDEAIQSVDKLNYSPAGNSNEKVYVQRYTDENHLRFLRFHELLVTGIDDEKELRKRFDPYGQILQAKYDPLFHISRVFFIERKSAVSAASNEECASLAPLSTMAFIRNLPFTTTDSDVIKLTEPFGKVLGFVYRDLVEEMKGVVVEVMFSSHDEAFALKTALHHKKIENSVIEVNASTLEEVETPIWKMQQRKRWITCITRVVDTSEDNKNENNNDDDDDDDEDDESESDNEELSSTDESAEYNDYINNIDASNSIENNGTDNKEDTNNDNENIDTDNKEESSNRNKNEFTSIKDDNGKDGSPASNANNNNDDDDNQYNNSKKNKNADDAESELKNEDDEFIDEHTLITLCETVGTVVDVKTKTINYNDESDSKHGPYKYQKIFVLFANPISATQFMRKVKNHNIKMATIGEFVNEILPEQFILRKLDSEDLISCTSQPTAVVINNRPSFMDDNCIHKMLSNVRAYEFVIEEDRAIIYTKSKRTASNIYKILYRLTSKPYIRINDVVYAFSKVFRYPSSHAQKNESEQARHTRLTSSPNKASSTGSSNQTSYANSSNQASSTDSSSQADRANSSNQASSTGSSSQTSHANSSNQASSTGSSSQTSHANSSNQASSTGSSNQADHANSSNHSSTPNSPSSFISSAEPNKMKIEMFVWFAVPHRPHFHPFERVISQRKMPIVIDPIPKSSTASEVRAFCDGCGRFDVKVQGSSCEVGKRRAIIQPRNIKAKMSCFEVFKNERFKGEFFTPVRIKKSEIPPPLDENIDDPSEYD